MFRNYLTVALRNLVRHKLYSVINIAGLAMGLGCVLFIILFVRDELSYDRWIPATQNLYRVELTAQVPDRPPLSMAVVPFPMPAAMQDESPRVTGMTRLDSEDMTLTFGDRQFLEQVDVVDPGFFALIRLPLVAGDRNTVFRQPDSIVLSQSAARKYFGDANPLGRSVTTGRGNCTDGDVACASQTVSLKVTGVMKDLPHNTQLIGDAFIPNTSLADHSSQEMKQNWFNEDGWGYVRLVPGTDPAAVAASMGPLLDRTVTPVLRKFGIMMAGSKSYSIHLTPFAEVHLASARWQFNMTPPGSMITLYGVVAIGVLILLIACFNFMNLATARAMLRAREIALRKTVGATHRQLVFQFLGEAILMALIALILALPAVEIMLPLFENFLQRPIAFHYLVDWRVLLLMLAVAVIAGLISGFYPALVLSRFRPASTLRGGDAGRGSSGLLRSLLVVLQFGVSIGLGIAAIVVFSQINFARNVELGFRHDNVLAIGGVLDIRGGSFTTQRRQAFVGALRANPGVIEVSQTDRLPFDTGQSLSPVQIPGQPDTITLNRIAIDPNYPAVFGIKLVAGRLLSDSRGDDRLNSAKAGGDPKNEGRNILVNVAGANRLGFKPEDAVGKTILFSHNHVTIVGVLADAKLHGALETVPPTAYTYIPSYPLNILVRLRSDDLPRTLAFIDRTWRAFSPDAAIQRHFLDDRFAKLYSEDERQGTMFGIFVGIAIFIACLGLFGLAAFTAGRRTKEIGIRKVFGARTRDVVLLLLWQFSIPVLIANVIAWPFAWYYLNGWLQGFAYRISLSPLYFIGAGLVALVIAWATIFAHAYRVARANPINALRYE